jgi:hypothetical protein
VPEHLGKAAHIFNRFVIKFIGWDFLGESCDFVAYLLPSSDEFCGSCLLLNYVGCHVNAPYENC